jgi:hypothetical protein
LDDDFWEVRQKGGVRRILFKELREEIDFGLNVSFVFIFLEVDHFHE